MKHLHGRIKLSRLLHACICTICMSIIQFWTVPDHLSRRHQVKRLRLAGTKFSARGRKLTGTDDPYPDLIVDFPERPNPQSAPFEGLKPPENGARCPIDGCLVAFLRERCVNKINTHLDLHHNPRPPAQCAADIHHCMVQRWYNKGPIFEVTLRTPHPHSDSAPPPTDMDYLTALRTQLSAPTQALASDVDARLISPWHSRTRWLEYLDEKDPETMIAMVHVPAKSDRSHSGLERVDAAVSSYMKNARRLSRIGGDSYRQILATHTLSMYALRR